MADRQVTHTGKDQDGDITKLCTPGQSWSPRSKADAIADIEAKLHSYFVRGPGGARVEIFVVHGPTQKYLRTVADRTKRDNLDDLPNC